MPGHKGTAPLGVPEELKGAYMYDITEIAGADDLYDPTGIILKSERIAGKIFGAPTYYSTEGSSQCVKAMLKLALDRAVGNDNHPLGRDGHTAGKECHTAGKPYVICAGTAHKAFLSGTELLGIEVVRVKVADKPDRGDAKMGSPILSVDVITDAVDREIFKRSYSPIGVFVTYPDYYGNVIDLAAIKKELSKRGILLLVDGAHAAYFKFLDHSKYPEYIHPIDAGADICCCSAHKTLPALTGAAYLHISVNITQDLPQEKVLKAMSLFGSSSPSYLILASLDAVNGCICNACVLNGDTESNPCLTINHDMSDAAIIDKSDASGEVGFTALVNITSKKVAELKDKLISRGLGVLKSDPLRLVIRAGADETANPGAGDALAVNPGAGDALAAKLRRAGCEPECVNGDDVIMMLSPYNTDRDLERIYKALTIKSDEPERRFTGGEESDVGNDAGNGTNKGTGAGALRGYDILKNFI